MGTICQYLINCNAINQECERREPLRRGGLPARWASSSEGNAAISGKRGEVWRIPPVCSLEIMAAAPPLVGGFLACVAQDRVLGRDVILCVCLCVCVKLCMFVRLMFLYFPSNLFSRTTRWIKIIFMSPLFFFVRCFFLSCMDYK